jgi:GntR family transcriptional regulator
VWARTRGFANGAIPNIRTSPWPRTNKITSSRSRKKSDRTTPDTVPRLVVDERNRVPLYHQLYLILRGKIDDGEYANGSYLPSEHVLARTYAVSRITAIRALNELAAQELVVRERGRGTRVRFVSHGTVVRGPAVNRARRFSRAEAHVKALSHFASSTHEPDYRVLRFETVMAPSDVAKALGLSGETAVVRVDRVGHFERTPYCYLVTYVLAEIARAWTRRDLERRTVFELLQRAKIGVERVDENITAVLADAILAQRLDIAAGSPLLKISGNVYGPAQRPIENVTAIYRPDRFQYTVSSERARAAGPDGETTGRRGRRR